MELVPKFDNLRESGSLPMRPCWGVCSFTPIQTTAPSYDKKASPFTRRRGADSATPSTITGSSLR